MSELTDRLRKVCEGEGMGYREAIFSVYAHLPEFQMYLDFEAIANALEAQEERIAELEEALTVLIEGDYETVMMSGNSCIPPYRLIMALQALTPSLPK